MDHESLVRALKEPSFYDRPVKSVQYIQTHISSVFLTDDRAYKLKKPVDFGFLDFTTPELRGRFCEAEVELNRRLAPETYLGTARITLDQDRPTLNGTGEAIDHLVVMRRLDGDRMGLEVLRRGELSPEMIDQLVDRLEPFYRAAATGGPVNVLGGVDHIRYNVEENFQDMEHYLGQAMFRTRFQEIVAYAERFLVDRVDLFQRRIDQGRIRECHGDLHLGNICFQDPPVIFDCIEFNQRFRCHDVASDLGFLAMDLDFHGRRDLSRRLIDLYIDRSGDGELAELINFYKCYRACVRGKIHSFTSDDPALDRESTRREMGRARRYFKLAHRYAGGKSKPTLVVLYGLMATGKSALGRYMAEEQHWPVYNSDVIRKNLVGVDWSTRVDDDFNRGLYSPEMSRRTYDRMLELAEDKLAAGTSVILDGSYKSQAERDRAVELAERFGADCLFVQTVCDDEEQRRRLIRRRQKTRVSDGRLEIRAAQAADFAPQPQGDDRYYILNTMGPKSETRAKFLEILSRLGAG